MRPRVTFSADSPSPAPPPEQALDAVFSQTPLRRDEVFVTGKLWNANHGAGKVEKACRKTLRDLRLKQLDLYLIHWPVAGANRGAAVTPSLRETWQAMEALVDAGLVKAIGLSNFSVKKAKDVLEYARVRPSVMQVSPSGGDDKVAAQLCYTWVSLWSSH